MANVHLLIDGCRGQYIPREFVTGFDLSHWQGVSDWARARCADPAGEHYWDAWQDILDNAYHIAPDGRRFTLHQDGDLWTLCYDTMTAEEKNNFGFEEACERDLAHEADMRRLAREQLRGEDFSDEEIFPERDDRDFF